MKRTRQAAAEKRVAPDEKTLEQLAKLPKDVQQMVLGYAYGLMTGSSMRKGANA